MSELKRLRWQCRRGAKELDALLLAYLEQVYSDTSQQQQQSFQVLLQYEDNQLLAYFYADKLAEQPEIRRLIASIQQSFKA